MAAVGGLALAFLLVAAISIFTPDADLGSGRAAEAVERFQFEDKKAAFIEGTVVRLDNRGAVPLALELEAPDKTVTSFEVAAGASVNITLDDEGTYRLGSPLYPWVEAEWTVRTSNPVVRYFEDLF